MEITKNIFLNFLLTDIYILKMAELLKKGIQILFTLSTLLKLTLESHQRLEDEVSIRRREAF